MKTVLLLGGPAAGQRVEVHGCMRSVFGQVNPTHAVLYNVVPMCSHGEVHWFGVLDGADPLALLIAGYGSATTPVFDENTDYGAALIEMAAYGDERASERLRTTGSFSWFDEPEAVKVARSALNALGYQPMQKPSLKFMGSSHGTMHGGPVPILHNHDPAAALPTCNHEFKKTDTPGVYSCDVCGAPKFAPGKSPYGGQP